jgi:hypothetical protein
MQEATLIEVKILKNLGFSRKWRSLVLKWRTPILSGVSQYESGGLWFCLILIIWAFWFIGFSKMDLAL